jgi:lactoylglutathione lyase
VLRCNDIEKSKVFYEKLGASFVKEKHSKGPEHYAAEFCGMVFELYPLGAAGNVDNTRIGFDLTIAGELGEVLRSLEIEVHSSYEFNERLVLVVQDPDARKVELCQIRL